MVLPWRRVNMVRSPKRKETGQAFSEYAILYPGTILLAILGAVFLGPSISDIYRHIASIFSGQKPCVIFTGKEDNEYCSRHDDCMKTDYDGEESGSFTYDGELSIEAVVIKAGLIYEIRRDDPNQYEFITEDGCYKVTIKTNQAKWERIGSGTSCPTVSHVDYWSAPLCTDD
jgi:hypothetical protein